MFVRLVTELSHSICEELTNANDFIYGAADATTPPSLALLKSEIV